MVGLALGEGHAFAKHHAQAPELAFAEKDVLAELEKLHAPAFEAAVGVVFEVVRPFDKAGPHVVYVAGVLDHAHEKVSECPLAGPGVPGLGGPLQGRFGLIRVLEEVEEGSARKGGRGRKLFLVDVLLENLHGVPERLELGKILPVVAFEKEPGKR